VEAPAPAPQQTEAERYRVLLALARPRLNALLVEDHFRLCPLLSRDEPRDAMDFSIATVRVPLGSKVRTPFQQVFRKIKATPHALRKPTAEAMAPKLMP
jgi:hypothetical protein